MSLNQLIDTTNVKNRKYLDIKVNSLNDVGALKLNNSSGADGQVVVNSAGLPTWDQISSASIQAGPDNTYLYSLGGGTFWQSTICRVASFSPYGVTFIGVDEGAQDIAIIGIGTNLVLNEFQHTLISNIAIVNHSNDTDFVIQKTGLYQITLVAPVYKNSNSVSFMYVLNGDTNDINYGWACTSPIDDDKFQDVPGSLNAAGQSVTLSRVLYLEQGTIFQVYSNKQAQSTPGDLNNFYVGQRAASLTFVYLGTNYVG